MNRAFELGLILISAAIAGVLLAQPKPQPKGAPPAEYTYAVVHDFPHDPNAYTQGLEYRDGFLYEGTGLNGRSSLRKVRLETGQVVKGINIAKEHFGEGITLVGDEILQLTWLSQVGFVYGRSDFRLRRRFSYSGEGWGLASNSREVFMSDGTDEIRVMDSRTLTTARRVKVRARAEPVNSLNELEFVEGQIFANVYQTDRIARIDPGSGQVVGWIDLSGLLSPVYRRSGEAVLNGIAYDAGGKRLFVTGKLWPRLFEIRLVPKSGK